jgi:hypothetical protein
MEVTFHIADEDKSYISGKIQLIKVTSGSEESLGETDIKINKNGDGTVNFNGLEVKQEYIARFVITYNRHNKDDEKIEEKYETSNVDEEIELIGDGDYNLKISELTTLSEGKETSIFNKNQEITLSFASENSSVFVPDSIKVDGKAYSVEKGESTNKYIAKIDGFTTAGEKTISVESMTLSNGKELELEENNTVKVTINKTVPTAKDFVAEENLTDKNIKVSFNLVDEENTVQSIAIELYNAAGSVIDSKNIAVSDISDTGKIELTLSTANAEKTDKYTVKVIANYKLIESAENTESSTILSQDVDAIVYANIESASISNSCVEKGEDVIIIYKIDTNSKSDVSKICINGLNYAAEKLETGDYKVTLKAADGAGEQEFNATKVIFENSDDNNTEDKVVDASKELKVKADVLKSVPQIDGEIEQIDDVKNHSIKLKFTLEDIDDAYVSGKVELRKVTAAENNKGNANAEGDAVTENSATENNEVVTESIISKSEDNECTVELTGLESDTKYTAKFLITYNRHNIKTEMSNENKNEILPVEDKEIELIVNCNLTINDIEALKDGEYTTVFEKNDEIKLAFYSTNTSGFEPESAVINDEEYTLSKENDKYIALLDGYAKAGSKIITIQSITLENGREISVDKNNTITIIVNNTVPTVENFTSEENEEDKTVRV